MKRVELKMLIGACGLAGTLGLVPLVAVAGNLSLDGQDREVSVRIGARTGSADNINVLLAPPGFGLFDQTIDRTLVIGDPPPQISSAFANQLSSQTTEGSDFVFDASGSVSYDSEQTDTLTFADSEYAVTFTLDSDTNYTLSGNGTYKDGAGGAGGYRVALLRGTEPFSAIPSDVVFNSFAFTDSGPDGDGSVKVIPFIDAGILGAGTYTIVGDTGVSGGISGDPVVGGYDLELRLADTVPEPAVAAWLVGLVFVLKQARNRSRALS